MSLRELSVHCVVIGLCVVALSGAQDYGPSAAAAWQSYPPAAYNTGGGGGGGPSNCGPGINDVVSNIASYKTSILQTGLSAGVAALLAKLPGLIFLKVIVLKLIVVPMLFMLVAVPVMMPLMMLLMPMMQQMMNMMSSDDSTTTTTTTTVAPASRRSRGVADEGRGVDDVDEVLRSVLTSHRCLERVACKLGAKDKASPYRKPITWLLKQLQGMVPPPYRDRVKTYRQAYIAGGSLGQCGEEYPCDTPEVLVRQESRMFRIL